MRRWIIFLLILSVKSLILCKFDVNDIYLGKDLTSWNYIFIFSFISVAELEQLGN